MKKRKQKKAKRQKEEAMRSLGRSRARGMKVNLEAVLFSIEQLRSFLHGAFGVCTSTL